MESLIHLLYVDDDQNDCLLLTSALEQMENPCVLHCEPTPAQALDWLIGKLGTDEFPHLVISDGSLRSLGGSVRLIEQIRCRFPVLPILVFSGNPMQERVDGFYSAGANGFIYKGTGFDEFSRQLAGLIGYWTDLLILPSRPKA